MSKLIISGVLSICLVVTYGRVYCHDEFECKNQKIIQSSNRIECYGYGSCYDANITLMHNNTNSPSDFEIYCNGLRSCQNAEISIKNSPDRDTERVLIDVNGYLGLLYAKNLFFDTNYEPYLNCYGEASCSGIKSISNIAYLDCLGARSCNDIKNTSISRAIYADGAFALKGSNFYSANSVSISLHGYYAGFNSSFYCREGHSCYVDCGYNGCVNFNYYCNENALKCEIECAFVPGNDFNGSACPNGWSLDGKYTGKFTKDITKYYESDDFSFSYTNNLIDKFFNKIYSQNINYEQSDCPNNDKIGNQLGCKLNDYQSCFDEGYLGDVNDSLCINGGQGIENSVMNITGENNTLYCNGDNSCEYSIIKFHNNNVYCRGDDSCVGDYFSDFGNIIATGYFALSSKTLINGDIVACFGRGSCGGTDFIGVRTIYVFGGGGSIINCI